MAGSASLKERAIEAHKQAVKAHEDYIKRVKEEEKERERNKITTILKRDFGVDPQEVQFILMRDEPPYWEAKVDGLRFKLAYDDFRYNSILRVAWECRNNCGNKVWYPVTSLRDLGELLSDEKRLIPCFACSEKEKESDEKAKQAELSTSRQQKKICPLLAISPHLTSLSDQFCMEEECAWWSKRFKCCRMTSVFPPYERESDSEV